MFTQNRSQCHQFIPLRCLFLASSLSILKSCLFKIPTLNVSPCGKYPTIYPVFSIEIPIFGPCFEVVRQGRVLWTTMSKWLRIHHQLMNHDIWILYIDFLGGDILDIRSNICHYYKHISELFPDAKKIPTTRFLARWKNPWRNHAPWSTAQEIALITLVGSPTQMEGMEDLVTWWRLFPWRRKDVPAITGYWRNSWFFGHESKCLSFLLNTLFEKHLWGRFTTRQNRNSFHSCLTVWWVGCTRGIGCFPRKISSLPLTEQPLKS